MDKSFILNYQNEISELLDIYIKIEIWTLEKKQLNSF